MSVKGLIFDLDGVIVFTDQFHYQAWKCIADKMGIYFDEEINNRLRGVSRMDSLNIILENYKDGPLSQLQKEQIAAEKNEIYRELLSTMSPSDVTEEVRGTLQELRSRGYQIALGSSSKNAKFILEQVKLTDAFDQISDGNNIKNSKPDPEVFLKGAEYLGLDPQECAVVEDAYVGIDAAKAGEMLAVAIGDAASYSKADICLDTFQDMLNYFK